MTEIILGLTGVDLALIGGVALVIPALGDRPRWVWPAVSLTVATACHLDRASVGAVLLGTVFLLSAVWSLVGRVRSAGPLLFWSEADVVGLVSRGYVVVAAAWFAFSRMGASPSGIHEPIVELTAVHFTYIGAGAITLAARARRRRPGRLSGFALLAIAGAPPVVAAGFVTGLGGLQVGGALLVTSAVWATASLELRSAADPGRTSTRVLLAVSGLAVWVPMVLAVAWAAGQHWDVPALSVPDMVRTHGALNAIGFVGAGLLAGAAATDDPAAR